MRNGRKRNGWCSIGLGDHEIGKWTDTRWSESYSRGCACARTGLGTETEHIVQLLSIPAQSIPRRRLSARAHTSCAMESLNGIASKRLESMGITSKT